MYSHTYTYLNVYINVCIFLYVCIHVYKYKHVHTYKHTYHIYVAYIHTYTYMNIFMYNLITFTLGRWQARTVTGEQAGRAIDAAAVTEAEVEDQLRGCLEREKRTYPRDSGDAAAAHAVCGNS